ncbi:MAG: chloride channel protein [Candidatus Bipolaricaulota bacterium]
MSPVRKLTEQTVLFVSVVKWFLLASVVGGLVGSSTALFLRLLDLATGAVGRLPLHVLALPFALFASAALVHYLAPEAKGHGTEKVIEAVHQRSGRIPLQVVPVKLAATVITLAAGGSAGKEGPCAQIGAGLASAFADLLRFDAEDRKKLVVCGISAGFAAVFGTPIAGSIFGVEVLFVGGMMYGVLLPSFVAGITAHQVAAALGTSYVRTAVHDLPPFSEPLLLTVLAAGVFFGLCSLLLIEALRGGHALARRWKIWPPLQALAAGVLLVALSAAFSARYLGLGLETVEDALAGATIPWYAFLLKPLFTTLTLNFGGSGGIVTPVFFVGATAGAAFAQVFDLAVPVFAALGLVSVLSGAANTPIAASILAVEMFGPAIAPYAAVACIISFLMTGHRSVYPSQILSIAKSSSLQVGLGQEINQTTPVYAPRRRTLLAALSAAWRSVTRRIRRD